MEFHIGLHRLAEANEAGVAEIRAAESLHTNSLFIEHTEAANYFVWYLEAESMEQLIEAREASTHPLHEVVDAMVEEVLVDPTEADESEPLMHGVSGDRPHTFATEKYTEQTR